MGILEGFEGDTRSLDKLLAASWECSIILRSFPKDWQARDRTPERWPLEGFGSFPK